MSVAPSPSRELVEALRRIQQPHPTPRWRRLARDLVGHPTPPRHGVCRFCGGPAPRNTVCPAHTDLPQLDPTTGVHVTTATTTGRNH